jgi:hypothetical protein
MPSNAQRTSMPAFPRKLLPKCRIRNLFLRGSMRFPIAPPSIPIDHVWRNKGPDPTPGPNRNLLLVAVRSIAGPGARSPPTTHQHWHDDQRAVSPRIVRSRIIHDRIMAYTAAGFDRARR